MKRTLGKICLLLLFMGIVTVACAQDSKWKLGANMGYANNSYQMNTSYQSDWMLSSRGGVSAGVSGQYNIKEWFGIRADFMFMQKNYRKSRQMISNDCRYTNNYLQLPVMANFSVGGGKLHGFANLGVYAGYWTSSKAEVNATDVLSQATVEKTQDIPFNSERDNRFAFGYVAGAGVEYRIAQHWSIQGEARCYYDVTSQVKQYQENIRDHRYNTTLGLQLTGFYHF